MNQGEENKQCQICKGYLFEDDDVVICPVCGAPHHRDCWQSVGHCGVEGDHGTENQYNKVKARETEQKSKDSDSGEIKTCTFCGRESHSNGGVFCPYCGQAYSNGHSNPNQHRGPNVFMGGMPNSDFVYGGLDKEAKIEDVKVEHIAKFVGANSTRYLSRFAALSKKKKGSWNWAAFISPAAWCFSRKMYLYGVIFFIVTLAVGICSFPFLVEYDQLVEESDTAVRSMYAMISENYDKFSLIPMLMMTIGGMVELVMMLLVGRYGDWLYRSHTLESVKRITSASAVEDVDIKLASSGSVSLLWAVVILTLGNYLPQLIATMLW